MVPCTCGLPRGSWEGLGDHLGLPPTSAHWRAGAAAPQEVQGKAAFLSRPLAPPLPPTFPYKTHWAPGPGGEGWGIDGDICKVGTFILAWRSGYEDGKVLTVVPSTPGHGEGTL